MCKSQMCLFNENENPLETGEFFVHYKEDREA